MIILFSSIILVMFLSVFWLRFKGVTSFKLAELSLKDKFLFFIGLPGAITIMFVVLPFMLVENVIHLFNIIIKAKFGIYIEKD